jgi:hypothetical protein
MKHPLCALGKHKWLPIPGTERLEWINKFVAYVHAKGVCLRCGDRANIKCDYFDWALEA